MTRSADKTKKTAQKKSPEKKVAALPSAPGVYQFKNASGKVIYVGKAKSLRARVRSYFGNSNQLYGKT
ncbi:MAG: GIY-YIG nuclease family protein, partial [Chlorobiales bacterium]|nr:GIY-YIG nuclease family protein [Chlorobiales bacterium]